eukprot:3121891-Rhodomonas_salina.1
MSPECVHFPCTVRPPITISTPGYTPERAIKGGGGTRYRAIRGVGYTPKVLEGFLGRAASCPGHRADSECTEHVN